MIWETRGNIIHVMPVYIYDGLRQPFVLEIYRIQLILPRKCVQINITMYNISGIICAHGRSINIEV